MKGSSTLLCVVVLAACASAAPATPLAPIPDAAATMPAPAPSPAAGPSTDEASTLAGEAAPAPAPEPMPRLETGPDRYQVPSVFMDDSSGVLIVDLAAGTGTGLARKAQRGKTPARWVTRRAKEAVVVEVERIDLPLPAGVEPKPTWGPKNPDAPKSTDVLLGEGWVERAIVLRHGPGMCEVRAALPRRARGARRTGSRVRGHPLPSRAGLSGSAART